MLCTTLANGEAALDLTWFKKNPAAQPTLNPTFIFNKEIDYSHTEDEISDFSDVLLRYPTYYGYIVRTNDKRSNVIASKTGHSDIFDLWITKDWCMLIYRKAESSADASVVHVVGKAKMNIAMRDLTPLGYLASPMAKLLGTPPSSYLIVAGNLFEIFDCATIGIMDADYQIYSGMSLVAAFNARAGSLGLTYWPANKRAAVAMFFNKDLSEKQFVDLPNGWGVYFTSAKRVKATSLINNIRNGIKITDTDWCKIYPTPSTKARSTAALPSFVCRFSGVQPTKALASGEQQPVVYNKIIFQGSLPGEGVADWINGTPHWEVAQFFESTSAELAGIVGDYNNFMREQFALASSRIIKGLNASIDGINTTIEEVQDHGDVDRMISRSELREVSTFDTKYGPADDLMGRLTTGVKIKFRIPVKSLFPAISGKVVKTGDSLASIINSMQQNTPKLLDYLKLLTVECTKDGVVSYKSMVDFAKDTTVYDSVTFGVTDTAKQQFADVIDGNTESSLTNILIKNIKELIGSACTKHASGSAVTLLPSDGARQSYGYTYGCKHEYKETAWGWWIGTDQLNSVSWKPEERNADGSIYIAFPVNHSTVPGTAYGARLAENGFSNDVVLANKYAKAFDFAIESAIVENMAFDSSGKLSDGTKLQLVIDDFEIESVSRYAGPKDENGDSLSWADVIKRVWSGALGDTAVVHHMGTGRYCLPSCTTTVKTGSCFWNKSDWGGHTGTGRQLETVAPSQRYRILFERSEFDQGVAAISKKFTSSPDSADTPMYSVLDKLNADLNAVGLKYLLARLAQFGDLKECKMLVKADTIYIRPALAKYFTSLVINKTGAKAIEDAVEELITLRTYEDGAPTGDAIMDSATISALREIATDMQSLALDVDEHQPWYADSSDIAVASGKKNLDALGLYLYL